MRSTDGRGRSREEQEGIRRLGVALLKEGVRPAEVARRLSVRKATVSEWSARFAAEGDEGLATLPTPGRPPKLNAKQVRQLYRIVVGQTPRQLSFEYALWTAGLVKAVIAKKFGVQLHVDNVRKLLRGLGLTPQVPTQRAYRRSEAACERWILEDFPSIAAEVRRKQAVLLFLDETGVQERAMLARTWAPRGQRPEVVTRMGRNRVNVISAVSPSGRLWFRCYKGTLNAARMIEFLRDLLRDIRGRIVLVWDRHRAHIAKEVAAFLATVPSGRLSVHLLPAYAPELNPDEHVWWHLKRYLARAPLRPFEDLDTVVHDVMTSIQDDRPILRKIFHAPHVRYVIEATRKK